jgi:3-methyl-2-oxobutanoate hydroxymethyltransferase
VAPATQKVTLHVLRQMKREQRKIVAVGLYDYQMAQIVDRSGVDIVSVGDSVGPNMWGLESEHDVTLEQMLMVCTAVRRGVTRALVSCDFPGRVLDEGVDVVIRAARRLVDEGGADVVKVDGLAETPEVVQALTDAGVPVWAQLGGTGKGGGGTGKGGGGKGEGGAHETLINQAKQLEAAGAVMLNFTHSGPVAGPAVVQAVSIPVLGGLGGGPWLDGRIRVIGNAIGYLARALDDDVERYANVARITLDAIAKYADDVRGGRQVKGEPA